MTTIAEAILDAVTNADDSPIIEGGGAGWASPRAYRQQQIIKDAAGRPSNFSGNIFADGSALIYEARAWSTLTADAVARRETGVTTNTIGLTRYRTASDSGPYLADQLSEQGVAFERLALPHLTGMDGSAYLVGYTSHTGQPVTVLCIPQRSDIDSFGEDYYYFEDMIWPAATAKPEPAWLVIYDQARRARR